MANIAASNVTVTLLNQRRINGRTYNNVQLSFGDGVLTYPAGGVPITIGALGCPNVIESLTVYDRGTSGYEWSYDRANQKLVGIQSPSHTHNLLLRNAAVADGATTRVNAGANLLGANTGSDITVAGGGANGGVVASVAAPGSQPTGVAIANQVLRVEVVGW